MLRNFFLAKISKILKKKKKTNTTKKMKRSPLFEPKKNERKMRFKKFLGLFAFSQKLPILRVKLMVLSLVSGIKCDKCETFGPRAPALTVAHVVFL